jgi:hypothetical protein
MEEGPKIVTKAYDVTSWLLQQVNTFPRAYRFVLGDRIATTALDILEGWSKPVIYGRSAPCSGP